MARGFAELAIAQSRCPDNLAVGCLRCVILYGICDTHILRFCLLDFTRRRDLSTPLNNWDWISRFSTCYCIQSLHFSRVPNISQQFLKTINYGQLHFEIISLQIPEYVFKLLPSLTVGRSPTRFSTGLDIIDKWSAFKIIFLPIPQTIHFVRTLITALPTSSAFVQTSALERFSSLYPQPCFVMGRIWLVPPLSPNVPR